MSDAGRERGVMLYLYEQGESDLNAAVGASGESRSEVVRRLLRSEGERLKAPIVDVRKGPMPDGYRFKIARELRGDSQIDLGRALGVDRTTVSQWERGRAPLSPVARAWLTKEEGAR